MTYTQHTQISSVAQVQAFFRHLAGERKVSFHPDDDFSEYVHYTTGKPLFCPEEAQLYNRLMDESFAVCCQANRDIYEIGLEEIQRAIVS